MPKRRTDRSRLTQTEERRIKDAAGWSCQNCGRSCQKSGESFADFIQRNGREYRAELERAAVQGLPGDRRTAFTLVLMDCSTTDSGKIALCASCAMHYIRPVAAPRHQRWRQELQGQLTLFT